MCRERETENKMERERVVERQRAHLHRISDQARLRKWHHRIPPQPNMLYHYYPRAPRWHHPKSLSPWAQATKGISNVHKAKAVLMKPGQPCDSACLLTLSLTPRAVITWEESNAVCLCEPLLESSDWTMMRSIILSSGLEKNAFEIIGFVTITTDIYKSLICCRITQSPTGFNGRGFFEAFRMQSPTVLQLPHECVRVCSMSCPSKASPKAPTPLQLPPPQPCTISLTFLLWIKCEQCLGIQVQ